MIGVWVEGLWDSFGVFAWAQVAKVVSGLCPLGLPFQPGSQTFHVVAGCQHRKQELPQLLRAGSECHFGLHSVGRTLRPAQSQGGAQRLSLSPVRAREKGRNAQGPSSETGHYTHRRRQRGARDRITVQPGRPYSPSKSLLYFSLNKVVPFTF